MFCIKCGTEIAEGSGFCPKCGKPIGQEEKRKPIVSSRFLLGIIALFVVLGFLVYWANESGNRSGADPVAQMARAIPPPVHHFTTPVLQGGVSLEAGQLKWVEFTIPDGAKNIHIKGHFEATGGSGNDIQAVLTDEDGFQNWRNGHKATSYYGSGKVTADTLNVNLPTGSKKYYFVLDNRFSLMSNKAVTADVKLEYDR